MSGSYTGYSSSVEYFSNHGGQFKGILSNLRQVKLKIFSNHGGQFNSIFDPIREIAKVITLFSVLWDSKPF